MDILSNNKNANTSKAHLTAQQLRVALSAPIFNLHNATGSTSPFQLTFQSYNHSVQSAAFTLDNYVSPIVSYRQNLDNCTENARCEDDMRLPKGADAMNRRQKLKINGKERWVSFSSTQDLVNIIENEISKVPGEEKKLLVRDYLMSWFEKYEKPRLDPNTAAGHISKIKKHILPVIGSKELNDVTVADVQTIMSHLTSASMGKQVKSIINLCFEAAIADELFHHPNPARDKRIIMPNKVEKRTPLSKNDLTLLIDFLPRLKPEYSRLLVILIMTGCRRGEALGVRWEDIDWSKKTLHLQRVVRFRNNRPEVSGKMKTKAANQTVSIWGKFIPYLGEPQASGFVVNCDGEPLTERQYMNRWNAIQRELKAAGIEERFTAHQLRHTYATIAANSGSIAPKVLQGMLGHANFQTTMNTYTDRDTDKMVESSQHLSAEYAQFASKSCSDNCRA